MCRLDLFEVDKVIDVIGHMCVRGGIVCICLREVNVLLCFDSEGCRLFDNSCGRELRGFGILRGFSFRGRIQGRLLWGMISEGLLLPLVQLFPLWGLEIVMTATFTIFTDYPTIRA